MSKPLLKHATFVGLGVGSDTVEMMEEKLRFEILALLEERGEFEVSLESSDFGLLKEALKLKSVMTPHGVYAGLAAKQGLQVLVF